MERIQSWEQITQTGKKIGERWKKLADKYGLNLKVSGLPALIGFSFPGSRMLEYKTLITQEMLAQGYLAANSVYVCTEHTQQVLDGYFDALDPVFSLIAECEAGRDLTTLLKSPVCHSGFKRLN
jgi:glutamate-1-semialdehyde 2,1-aminomutase